VQVPPFINEGDRIRVNTETGTQPASDRVACLPRPSSTSFFPTSFLHPQFSYHPMDAAASIPTADRGHHGQHVQRQMKSYPSAAPCADRPTAGADLQAADRRSVQ
jgi:hypothetical protein